MIPAVETLSRTDSPWALSLILVYQCTCLWVLFSFREGWTWLKQLVYQDILGIFFHYERLFSYIIVDRPIFISWKVTIVVIITKNLWFYVFFFIYMSTSIYDFLYTFVYIWIKTLIWVFILGYTYIYLSR